ncbi:hypothetical protein [Microcoleus sp. herbarium5]|uniref:hypothetical protein n=1 Tax=Microcoleus sp. herbarium5 TaxID=3055434 RepID=UPI002FD26147
MANQEDLKLIEFTIGLYEQSLKLLKPGSDNFSILSGCILLTVGLEKLIKSVLYDENPLMILYDKIEFKDLIKFKKGDKFKNCKTISFEKALERLVELFPTLKKEAKDIKDIEYIIKQRNFLMHNFGYINIGALEIKVQTKVADISELICKECLGKSPEEIFGLNVWTEMVKTREAYKDANILELKERILHLRRHYLQGQALPCEEIDIPKSLYTQVTICPVCEKNTAEVAMDCDVDFDEYGILSDISPYLSLLKCQCGFTIVDIEEIEPLLGEEKYYDIIESIKISSRESA